MKRKVYKQFPNFRKIKKKILNITRFLTSE